MDNLRPVVAVLGAILAVFGLTMTVPLATSWAVGDGILDVWPAPMALTVIVGAGCVAGAFVLEALGLVGPTFHFEAEQLVLHAPGLRSWGATLAFVGVVSVAAVVTTAAALSRVRDALADVERRLYIYAWHLREVVPASVRPTTDPTVGRRKRPPREA